MKYYLLLLYDFSCNMLLTGNRVLFLCLEYNVNIIVCFGTDVEQHNGTTFLLLGVLWWMKTG